MRLKHRTQTALADDPNYDVSADEWNEDHELGLIVPGFYTPLSGWYFTPGVISSNNDGVSQETISDGDLYLIPTTVGIDFSVDQLAVDVATAQTGANVRIVVYDDDGTLSPNNLLHETSNIDCSSSGNKTISVTGLSLEAGVVYWFGMLGVHSGTAPTMRAWDGTTATNLYSPTGTSSISTIALDVCHLVTGQGDTAPDPAPSIGTTTAYDTMTHIRVRRA